MKFAISLLFTCVSASVTTISNDKVRQDHLGNLMDTHDGNIMQWEANGLYWFYSMGYQDCEIEHGLIPPRECPGIYDAFGKCGFRTDHALRVYSSPDLATWTLEHENAYDTQTRPFGVYFRPKVVYNKQTEKYVLWINHLPDANTALQAYGKTDYSVAVSDSPQGPFEFMHKATLPQDAPGDSEIFVDENGVDAYIIYNGWYNDHTLAVQQLNSDFTDCLVGSEYGSGDISPAKREAPIMFQRNGWYYFLFGHTCCFCKEGSGAYMKYAKHPLGPWTDSGVELNPIETRSYHRVRGQNSFVFRIAQADNSTGYVFASDLWSSAADNLKSHDLQYWHLLKFDDSVASETQAPLIAELQWEDEFTLDLLAPSAELILQ